MSASDPIGYHAELVAKRWAVLAFAPASAQRRILGRPRVFRPEKSHTITVNCATGERIVIQAVSPPPAAEPIKPARRIWKIKVKENEPPPHVLRVLAAVADAYGMRSGVIQGRGRTWPVAFVRFAWIRLLKEGGRSYAEIGRNIHRDHTSCMHACARAAELRASDKNWRHRYEAAHIALAGGVC